MKRYVEFFHIADLVGILKIIGNIILQITSFSIFKKN